MALDHEAPGHAPQDHIALTGCLHPPFREPTGVNSLIQLRGVILRLMRVARGCPVFPIFRGRRQ